VTLIEDELRAAAEHAWYHALLSDLDPPTLEEFVTMPAWTRGTACRGMGSEINLFPCPGESPEPAWEVCARCAVRAECLDYAMTVDADAVWGGTSARERNRLRRAGA